MATTIKIRNIGPIQEADLINLNKVNVFMGPQSSGKSTIAKIISYCTWVEKDVATSQSLNEYQKSDDYFKNHLEKYHKLKGYFKPNSYISYKSNVIEMEYDAGKFSIEWKDRYAYKRSKISYIPSERNMVILPEVKKVEFGHTYIRSFLFDWLDARKKYSKDTKMPVLNLNMGYFYNETLDEDYITGNQNNEIYNILLPNASSGLQSVTPLLTMINYLTDWLYNEDGGKISFEREQKQKKTIQNLFQGEGIINLTEKLQSVVDGWQEKKIDDKIDEMKKKKKKVREIEDVLTKDDFFNHFINTYTSLFTTHNSQLIIEEPEQNLFPATQRDLIYHLLEKCVNSEKDHRLTITTHSPYILYALNNCMMGKLVFDKMDESDKNSLACKRSLVNPENVSIYQIENGVLKNIQQEEDGLIGKNYFDDNMKALMDDFYKLLEYYGDEE